MGECISLVFKTAQILSKNGLATIQKIKEENVESKGRSQINPKINVILTKSAQFEKLTEGLTLRENWSVSWFIHLQILMVNLQVYASLMKYWADNLAE